MSNREEMQHLNLSNFVKFKSIHIEWRFRWPLRKSWPSDASEPKHRWDRLSCTHVPAPAASWPPQATPLNLLCLIFLVQCRWSAVLTEILDENTRCNTNKFRLCAEEIHPPTFFPIFFFFNRFWKWSQRTSSRILRRSSGHRTHQRRQFP